MLETESEAEKDLFEEHKDVKLLVVCVGTFGVDDKFARTGSGSGGDPGDPTDDSDEEEEEKCGAHGNSLPRGCEKDARGHGVWGMRTWTWA